MCAIQAPSNPFGGCFGDCSIHVPLFVLDRDPHPHPRGGKVNRAGGGWAGGGVGVDAGTGPFWGCQHIALEEGQLLISLVECCPQAGAAFA